jgi:hypothetical protein
VVDDIYEHHVMLYGFYLVVMTSCSSISFSASSLLLCLVSMFVPSCISCHASVVIYVGGYVTCMVRGPVDGRFLV